MNSETHTLGQERLASSGITVNNIIAKLDLNIELDLHYLSKQVSHSSYEPERYPSLIFRPENLPTILLARSGVIIFTGGDSMKSIYDSHKAMAEEFNRIGLDDTGNKNDITVQNVVVTFGLGESINLNHISVKLGLENIEYEPEQFPGIVYRIKSGPVAMIFSSGKIVVTGGSSTEEILSAVGTVRELVHE